MPLTPEDVSNKRFTPVRLREGYDMGEVDQFLDEVEAELARLTKENDDLRGSCPRRRPGAGSPSTRSRRPDARVVEKEPEPEPEPEPTPEPEPVAAFAEAPAPQTIRVETVPEASNAAARLLEIATRNADELVDMAKNDADKIIGEARTKAERLDSESKVKADRLESDARTRQMLDTEPDERRPELFGDLERQRTSSTPRSSLRSSTRVPLPLETFQPAARGSTPVPASPLPRREPHAPKHLRSILGDEEG